MKFGSGSIGGSNHIAAAAFAHQAGLKVVHIPYQGDAGVITALMGKEIDAAMMPISGVKQQVEAGEFVTLAVSMAEVDHFHKGMKTFRELGVDFVFGDFGGGIFIPAKVSKDVVAKWRAGFAQTMKDPEVQKRLANLSIAANYVDGDEFQQMLKKWNPILEALVKDLGLRIAK
jgi:tripartite-type tricarboxylate transporter receptor subunit TctC